MSNKRNQNKIFLAGFILILLVVVWTFAKPVMLSFFKNNSDSSEAINAEIIKAPSISPQELFTKLNSKENFFLFDLRSDDDFAKGHIATAQKIAASDLETAKLKALGAVKTSDIILLNSGDNVLETAGKVNEFVRSGFVNAKYLQGGIDKWRNQGFLLVSSGGLAEDASKIKMMSLSDLASSLNSSASLVQFIDVRGSNDFAAGHVAGAINIPISEIEKRQQDISLVEKVVIYGAGEDDAAKAAATLFDLNFYNIWVFEGGLEAWKGGGGKIETGN